MPKRARVQTTQPSKCVVSEPASAACNVAKMKGCDAGEHARGRSAPVDDKKALVVVVRDPKQKRMEDMLAGSVQFLVTAEPTHSVSVQERQRLAKLDDHASQDVREAMTAFSGHNAITEQNSLPSLGGSRLDLKASLEELWHENERRRKALCQLFSKHADLAPKAADPAVRWYMMGCGSTPPYPMFKRTGLRSKGGLGMEHLPDALLAYIYSLAPKKVCRDMIVSKRFLHCLLKTDSVVLEVKSGAEVNEASLQKWGRGVHLIGKRCWGLSDKVTSALKTGWNALVLLDLSDNELEDESTKQLSSALAKSGTQLTSLSLCDNKITEVGARYLGAALAHLVHLQKLNLTGNRLGPRGARHLAAGLEKQRGVGTRLTHLGLGGNGIGLEGVASLVPIFLPNQASTAAERPGDARLGGGGGVLIKLDLSACSLGPLGIKALAPLLQCNTRLRELSLSRNDLEAEGARLLAPAIPSTLTELNLNFNNLGVEGAAALVPALRGIKSLIHLKLFGNLFGHEGAQLLLPVLEELTSLSSLYLSLNNIDAYNKSKMAGALRHRLRTFHI